ncbi:MAG: quinone-interacting membrane-bound oxidoreductase complex subunit QmoC [Nitrospirae bacterium]|nr:quinone-interacting membrane-bound oxidoreductase complex subunit QmoC [Nitrospirota bacterium]MBI3377075.1 quinone-interacting membrane-bound oxidoreductase complex subunit QmoC [Nitrospirota bacterium]
MTEQIIKPDLNFINDVISSGGESLKKCFQCATCSVVCNVTPDDKPFPRKEMLHAQWGLKDKLLSNPDIWLCHQCSDCTAYCPRGAKPGEVLGAIRKLSLQEFSVPGVMAKMVNQPKFLLLLLAVPALLYILFIAAQGFFSGVSIPTEDGKIVYGKFLFSLYYVDTVFTATALFAAFSLFLGITKYWKAMSAAAPANKGSFGKALIDTIKEILGHNRFRKCEVTKGRAISHMLVFYSFIGLFITTVLAFAKVIPEYFEHFGVPMHVDPSLLSGLTVTYKIIGNISAAALVIGILLIMLNRFKNQGKAGLGSYYDWLFISLVAGVGVSGLLAQFLRMANTVAAYPTYVVHLCLVFFLFAYAPFSKMAHMVYRATAMVFAKQAGRE